MVLYFSKIKSHWKFITHCIIIRQKIWNGWNGSFILHGRPVGGKYTFLRGTVLCCLDDITIRLSFITYWKRCLPSQFVHLSCALTFRSLLVFLAKMATSLSLSSFFTASPLAAMGGAPGVASAAGASSAGAGLAWGAPGASWLMSTTDLIWLSRETNPVGLVRPTGFLGMIRGFMLAMVRWNEIVQNWEKIWGSESVMNGPLPLLPQHYNMLIHIISNPEIQFQCS